MTHDRFTELFAAFCRGQACPASRTWDTPALKRLLCYNKAQGKLTTEDLGKLIVWGDSGWTEAQKPRLDAANPKAVYKRAANQVCQVLWTYLTSCFDIDLNPTLC